MDLIISVWYFHNISFAHPSDKKNYISDLEITQNNSQKLQQDSRGLILQRSHLHTYNVRVGSFTLDYLVCLDTQDEITSGKQIYIYQIYQHLIFESI